jgi:hypothetical protein
MPRSIHACRTVDKARKAPSSGRCVTFAIIAAHISRPDNVLRNDTALRARAREERFKSGTDQTWEAAAAILSQDSWQTRRDSNPRPLPPEGTERNCKSKDILFLQGEVDRTKCR